MSVYETIADIEDYTSKKAIVAKLVDETHIKCFVKDLIKAVGSPDQSTIIENIDHKIKDLRKIHKVQPSKSQMRYIYNKYYPNTPLNKTFGRFLIKKAMRSRSGVLVSTIVLRPDVFSCPKKCSYCPTETDLEGRPTQPKSYLSTEPAMLRAIQYNFDVRGQIWDRIKAYISTGNIQESSGSCKLEIILSGGTWESYPYPYRNQVMNEIYWAANTYGDFTDRPMLDIEEEIFYNETAKYRIIGMTIETRPDFITSKSIKDYCRWGVTRVQIGVQHYDDLILAGIKRECYTKDTIKALKMLKQSGFKIVCHLMPDLPGSSPELDKWMFDQAINNPDLQFDDVKVYPTAVCQSSDPTRIVKSDIADWYANGTYKPYAETNLNDLIQVLKYYKTNIQPWVRIQRLVRDIPEKSIQAGYEKISNLRQVIQDQMKKEGTKCNCIRCMEIGDEDKLMESAKLVVRPYIASEGQEYHISIESNEESSILSLDYWSYIWFLITYWYFVIFTNTKTFWSGNTKTYNGLIGFCRFRIDSNPGGGFIKELKDCALIREVHVYGHSLGVGSSGASSQHKGYGQLLVKTAEEIAITNGYKKIAVIAGVGTREYYKNKCGYHRAGTYMVKNLEEDFYKYKEMTNCITHFWVSIMFIIFISMLYNATTKIINY
jgi:ELP3 family radical SAM enzyme/protein acetyltransferase